ncbi:MAG: zinc ribbon domain-containing protein [Actinomycetota bacterium]
MKCPSCGAEVRDPEATFCARCGAPLRQSGEPTGDTTRESAPQGTSATVPVRDFAIALGRSFTSGGWPQAAAAAALGFLALLGLGALIVVAIVINDGLGPGLNALDVLAAVVLFGESIMGVDLQAHFDGGLEGFGGFEPAAFTMVWLGALLVFGYVLSWAVARTARGTGSAGAQDERGPRAPKLQALEGAKVALPFALYCLLAAWLFEVPGADTTWRANPGQAFVIGAFWAALFGALGGLQAGGSLRVVSGRGLEWLKSKRRSVYEGISAGGIMLGTTALTSAAAFLIIVIVALARNDLFGGLTIGGVVGGLIVLAFTLPNVLSLVASVALGAPLTARFGAPIGPAFGEQGFLGIDSLSIIGIGGRTSGGLAFLLLLIPVLSCLLGGFSAYRHSLDRTKRLEVLGSAAATYAGVLALLSLLNRVNFEGGAALFGLTGHVAANFFAVLLLGLVWGAVVGFAGWKLAEVQESAPQPAPPTQPE